MKLNYRLFQSTRPVRGATAFDREADRIETISIHAPRAGRDPRRFGLVSAWGHFNPRAPCGARLEEIVQRTESA